MEKNKKSEKGLNKMLFLGEIGVNGWQDSFVATPAECAKIAGRFDIPQVKSLSAKVSADWDGDLIRVTGRIQADMRRQCVISLEMFEEKMEEDFEALFAEEVHVSKNGEMIDDVEPVTRGRLDIFAIVAEQVGLLLNPFPKKPDVSGDYTEEEQNESAHPFANLKNLIKKD